MSAIKPYLQELHKVFVILNRYSNTVNKHSVLLSEFNDWFNSFDKTILIRDDSDGFHLFDLTNGNLTKITKREDGVILYDKFKYPVVTVDGSVMCHYTIGRKNPNNFELKEDEYSINMEVVSQIMNNTSELNCFMIFFINYFKRKNKLILNKSQGVHLNIDVSHLSEDKIKDIILNKYLKWEKDNEMHVRPHKSMYATQFDYNKKKLLEDGNLDNAMQKSNSIRYKRDVGDVPGVIVLEFRLISTLADNVENRLEELLSMWTPLDGGKTRSKKKIRNKTKKNKGNYIFVYGSLRKGLQNHAKLEKSKYIGTYKTKSKYYMIGLKSKAYPYVTSSKLHESLEPIKITGELYKVNDDLLKELDILEGHPHNYKRTKITIAGHNTYIYLLESEDMKNGISSAFERRFVPVPSGDWVEFLK